MEVLYIPQQCRGQGMEGVTLEEVARDRKDFTLWLSSGLHLSVAPLILFGRGH